MSYIPFVLEHRVDFFRQGYFNKMNIVGGTNLAMVGMMTGDKATENHMTLQMGIWAGGTVVVGPVAIGTMLLKGWVWKDIADSPAVFEPRSEGLTVSRFYIDREALSHGE
jgi:hypothetical protein